MPRKRKHLRANSPESQEALRATIIDAACRLFAKGGYEAVSMRKVAEKVGCTAGALYRYFPDKQSLLLHVWEDDMRYAVEYIRGATYDVSSPVQKVRKTLLSYLRYWIDNSDHFRILFGPRHDPLDRRDAPEVVLESSSTALYLETREHLKQALAGRTDAPKDLDLALQCLLSAVHGIMALHLSASQFPTFDLEQMAAVTIDAILAGWGVIEHPRTTAAALRRPPQPAA
jgi:AcrR family transcriptional regulator